MSAVRGILIVDDDPELLSVAAPMLIMAGYSVYTACSGQEGLHKWREHSNEIDLVLIDCVLPDIFGDEVAFRLLEQNRKLRVIFMSGNTPASLEFAIPLIEGQNFLSKPFKPMDLVRFVNTSALETAR